MMLKDYQQRSLDKLGAFFRLTLQHGSPIAFMKETERPYRDVAGLEGMPYICLRVPTGGGKTIMAAHAVGLAAREYLHAERVVCLWLVPSNVIREQTLAALKDRQHPYRQALDVAFGGRVVVIDLADALYLSHGDATGSTVILVSTLAALRVEETDGRKIYENNGNLQPHFVGLDDALKAKMEKEGDGRVIHSLANVLRLRRPVVIMDEAHNARTLLSFDTLKRFAPSCVIEFTATPEMKHNPTMGTFASNVLYHVSACELKAEDMIKLPIKLRTRPDWKQVLGDAIAKRKELETLADANEKTTGEYLRPLMLIQAQPQNKNKPTLTVEKVKEALMNDHQISEDQIAIATGQTRELDDVDLFSRNPIRFIITVQALKEGWDCSFAYVLCSLAEQHSARSVEQILGRVLRMPRARKKDHPDLNIAYAYASAVSWIKTAATLQEALVECGFHKLEAKDFVIGPETEQGTFDDFSMFGTATEAVNEAPDLANLEPALRDRVTFDETTKAITVVGIISDADHAALESCFTTPTDKKAMERLRERSQGKRTTSEPGAKKEPIRVPWLSVRIGDQLELFDEDHFLNAPWNLAKCDADLSEKVFPSHWRAGETGEIDITKAGKVELTHFVADLHEQIALITGESGWEVASLARWLDRNIRHRDIPQGQSSLFIHRLITNLMESRKATVEQLARIKYRLRDVVEDKIDLHRDAHRNQAFQAFLFGSEAETVEVNVESCFTFDEGHYAPNGYYEGSYNWNRHFFRRPGELKDNGEEFECAVFLDQMNEVKYWIRNLVRRPGSSFWLPTSTDKFYPDFVCLLRDGRILVVEYKGGYIADNADSKEKKAVGELWAAKSGGRCLFVMPVNRDWQAITACVAK